MNSCELDGYAHYKIGQECGISYLCIRLEKSRTETEDSPDSWESQKSFKAEGVGIFILCVTLMDDTSICANFRWAGLDRKSRNRGGEERLCFETTVTLATVDKQGEYSATKEN